ncbi:universal stress protein UspA-like protein [Aequorivita sublithincola DSM 14238]|uniref:Universal stress protein UspA-like protein n=1 Tax=Aequorivita sublithincola (strain DSM 14238 / LMG 21431 / ACAM 643 / 9-3) TaxID=746697 RepID=I3YU96_AEQSU|nr:universal stress protein [Aequorivita sublithincola]AFL80564.1 universal stress protein UspA-like protein [Aequorivita sublithincola DSM 14238]
MKNILVPVGSSENSASNLQYAIDLAREISANVFVVSVFQELSKVGGLSKVNTILKEDSENRLEEVLAMVDKKGVSVVAHPIKGEVLEGINRINKQIPIDLMVLPPRSNSIKEEVYLGKTSGKLVKQTNIPILVVPEGAKFQAPKTMLMAFKNGTFEHDELLEALRQFKSSFGTEVHILHVETPETTPEMMEVTENLKSLQTSYAQVEAATTFQAVIEHFQHFHPDMLCVIRRKRGFFKRLWEKNEIHKREFHTSKPLLVLPVQE